MQVYEFSDLVTDAGVGVLTLNADTMTTQLLCKHVLLDQQRAGHAHFMSNFFASAANSAKESCVSILALR